MGAEMLTQIFSSVSALWFTWTMFKQYVPPEIRSHIDKYAHKLLNLVNPYKQITFHEYDSHGFERSTAYAAIESYLSTDSPTRARRLKAHVARDAKSVVMSMDDYEEITDEFRAIKVWWASNKTPPQGQVISFQRQDENRCYVLNFHRRDREIITRFYLKHVIDEGKAIAVKTRQRKLYTNNRNDQGEWGGRFQRTMWSGVMFEHPATFDTLAIEEKKKKEIVNDLITFTKSKDYYKRIGKPWKRGYLLYGPPGTGKSSMIAAMANLLDYDVYDLELTTVKYNTDLRKLLIEISNKSIIVIEDIDCSLDLTGERRKRKEKEEEKEDEKDPISKKKKEDEKESKKSSQVTLSGLLNFIDGLWSACGGERIIIFTTNYLDKLDPALVRRGRMDMHIELSYCSFEAFKVLAKNYLYLESHDLFEKIKKLLEENKTTPADVAENLMPKSIEEDAADTCLAKLINAIEEAKEEAKAKAKAEEEEKERVKAEEEKRVEAEKEEKEKEQKSNGEVKEEEMAAKEVKENGVTDAN